MRPVQSLTLALIAAVATACAVQPVDYSYRMATEDEATAARTPIVCRGKDECDRAWKKAVAWVARHTGFRIQIATDSILETLGPGRDDGLLAFKLVRRPLDADRESLDLTAACSETPHGCRPLATADRARAAFHIFMLARP